MANRVQKFWEDFIVDPDTLQKSQSFQLVLWQGISGGDNRKKIWSKLGHEQYLSLVDVSTFNELPPSTIEELEASVLDELEQSAQKGVAAPATPEEITVIQTIYLQHARRNQLEHFSTGWGQLIFAIYSVTKDVNATIGLTERVHAQMQKYTANDNRRLLNDVLVLADVLMQELPKLCEHFNTCSFDVVDFADIIRAWVGAVLASFFPSVAVIRMLDIVLFEGPKSIMGFIYGVLKVTAKLMVQQSKEDFFAFFTNVPPSVFERQIEDALKFGYAVFSVRSKRIDQLRRSKSWSKTVAAPGPVTFVAGVGNPGSMTLSKSFEEKLGPTLLDKRRAQQKKMVPAEQPSRSASRPQPTTGDAPYPDVIFELEKMKRKNFDPAVSKVLEVAATELRRQHENIITLHSDLTLVQNDLNKANETLEEHGFESSGESSDESDYDEDEKSNAVPQGCVLYSKLFQHQQFPCLYMEGYLLKARKKSSQRKFGNLHRRFFVLQGSFITYFKSHRQSKPSRDISVDMRGRSINKIDRHKFGKFGFEISEVNSRGCLYLLFASNADERNVWVQVLHAAAES